MPGRRETLFYGLLEVIKECFERREFNLQDLQRELQNFSKVGGIRAELARFDSERLRRHLRKLVATGHLLEIKGSGRNFHLYKYLPENGKAEYRLNGSFANNLINMDLSDLKNLGISDQIISLSFLLKQLQNQENDLIKELARVQSAISECQEKMMSLVERSRQSEF
jgi:predicted ArsR family transcriptional regulator